MEAQEIVRILRKKYQLSPDNVGQVEAIKNYVITSFAYTEEGGFDPVTGEFYGADQPTPYKIRIQYHKPESAADQFLFLKP